MCYKFMEKVDRYGGGGAEVELGGGGGRNWAKMLELWTWTVNIFLIDISHLKAGWLSCLASHEQHTGKTERRIETPGAILTRVRFPSAARDFLQGQLSVQDSLTVFMQTPRPIACINICARYIGGHSIVWTQENTAHTGRHD